MISELYHVWRNPLISWLLRLALAAFILTLLFTQIDMHSVLNTLCLMRVELLLPIFTLYYSVRYLWAYQRSLCLGPLGMSFTVPHLFKIMLISSFYSLILPGNMIAGTAASWYKLSSPERKGIEVGALLIYLRLVDTLILLGIGLIGMLYDPRLASPYFRAIVVVILGGVFVLLLPFFSPTTTRLVERLCHPLLFRLPLTPWVKDKGRAVWKALTAFQVLRKRTIALLLGLSVLAHALGILIYYLLALAVDIHLSVFVVSWVRSTLLIVQMVPVSIAGLGVREASLVFLLRDYGVAQAQALSLSLAVLSVAVAGSGIVGGLLEGWDLLRRRHGISSSASKQKAEANTGIATQ